MNILSIPLDQIDVSKRLRLIDPDYADMLAKSMAEHGQMTPVEVRETPKGPLPFALVSGGHRIEALRIAGVAQAIATVFQGSDLHTKLREIDENLHRQELTALDRATFLGERKAIYEALHPQTKHGGKREAGQEPNAVSRFTADAALLSGYSESTIKAALVLYKRLPPDVRDRISGTPLASVGRELEQLAAVPPSEQRQVLDLLQRPISDGADRITVGQAIDAVRGYGPAPEGLQTADDKLLERVAQRCRLSSAFKAKVKALVEGKAK